MSGQLEGEVADGAEGLQVRWSPAVITQARQEARRHAADPEAPTPIREGLEQYKVTDFAAWLDAAGTLRDELGRATLVEAKDDRLDGAPARLLRLKLSPAMAARDRKYFKSLEATGEVWLGPDGVPLAAETRISGKGRAFLVITFATRLKRTWRFARTGDRLVTARLEEERFMEGAGEKGERRSRVALELLPATGR
jgi:hypothetical protein